MALVELHVSDHIATITLNRPEALNAVNAEMDDLLAQAWTRINADRDIWVAVLAANGPKAFCVGADLKDAERPSRVAFGGGLTGVGGPWLQLRKPLIAAVQGYALGGGFELAMCADLIVAAESAQFGLPEVKVGVIGESGVVHRAVRQLPYRIGMAMVLTGERLGAEAAARHGLVNEVVADGELPARAMALAEVIRGNSPLAVQAAKGAAVSRLGWPLDVALSTRFEAIEAYQSSADRVEGMQAFTDRRAPAWRAE